MLLSNRGDCRVALSSVTARARDGLHLFVVVTLMASWTVYSAVASAADPSTHAMRDDASLADVCFVDAECGWAVGDRGTIWHTSDGGAGWHLQESGVDCSLRTVQFIDRQHGFAAGGGTEPFSRVRAAVLLRTRDGGRTWQVLRQQGMGAVLRLKFVDARRGWALCLPNGLCGSGVLTTDDGGQDWTPIQHQVLHPWTCGDADGTGRGALAADGGATAVLRGREIRPGRCDFGLRRPDVLRLSAGGLGYLAGEGGLLLASGDGGETWRQPPGRLPTAAAGFDFRALAMSGERVWLAGSPGASVIHSPDGGKNWEATSTGTTLPITALSFISDTHGWAVGALGQILATTDGGRTWQVQRGAGHRAAYLGIFAEAGVVPLEMLAKLSAGEGYRGVISLVGRRDLEAPAEPPLVVRMREREALLHAGAGEISSAWQFPLRQAGLKRSKEQIVADWQRVSGELDSLTQLQAHLVREIRCWRPEMVVTHAAPRRGDSPLHQLIHEAVLAAVKQAAQPEKDAGLRGSESVLPPWRVKRIVTALADGERSSISLSGSQILPQLGRSLAEYTATAHGLLAADTEPEMSATGFVVAWDQAPAGEGYRDFFSGMSLAAPSAARRAPLAEAAVSLEQMRRLAQRRQTLQAIVSHQSKTPVHRAAWLAQIGMLTRDLDEPSAALLLYQLANQYRRHGQDDLAAETFTQIAENYPAQSGLAAAASLWLVQYYSSGEWTVRADREGRLPRQLASGKDVAESDSGVAPGTASLIPATENSTASSASQGGAKSVKPAAGEQPQVGTAEARLRLAQQWFQKLETNWPSLAAEPHAALPAARALTGTDGGAPTQRLTLGLMRTRAADAWWSCAASEHWLRGDHRARHERTQPAEAPKPVGRCRRTATRPRLDGRLDDVCWRGPEENLASSAIPLRSSLGDDVEWPAAVQLAYDNEFLYLAVTCRKAPGFEYVPAAKGARGRDTDLAGQDHVALLLDIDRDWTTYWRLAIDHRGLTAEDCWGDRTWNPQWFVAAGSDETTWTCEAAIPWNELAPRAPQPGEAWAAGVQRLVPGIGFQSWTTPATAATVRPEGFGLLTFE